LFCFTKHIWYNIYIMDKEKKGLKQIYDKFSDVGKKTTDRITIFIGSWWFILFFVVFVGFWILANSYFLFVKFDAYPFIFLNLILSLFAGVQTPVIMMNQHREMNLDRERMEIDYLVNQRAEKKIEVIEDELKQIKELIRKETVETRKGNEEQKGQNSF